jgi:hypothetical protein
MNSNFLFKTVHLFGILTNGSQRQGTEHDAGDNGLI